MRYRKNETGFSVAMIEYLEKHGSFVEAYIKDADFSDMKLADVDFSKAFFANTNFNYANLKRCKFKNARFENCTFRGAQLDGATFAWADISGCDFMGVSTVSGQTTVFSNVKAEKTNWSGSNLRDAIFWEAKLAGANFNSANLKYAELIGIDGEGCDFSYAELNATKFRTAYLADAKFYKAHVYHTNFEEASLNRADFTDSFVEEANFDRADISEVNFVGAVVEDTLFAGSINYEEAVFVAGGRAREATTYGRKRGLSKALKKVDAPIKAAAFKKMFPAAWEVLKQDLPNIQTLTPELSAEILKSYGMDWQVTEDIYRPGAQRMAEEPNLVFQMNVDIEALTSDGDVQAVLIRMAKMSRQSGHPTLPLLGKSRLFTVGWIRYNEYPDEGVLLVEEIQSDLPTVRKASDDDVEEFRTKLQKEGREAAFDQALAIMKPYEDRFYYDALSLMFDTALEKGLEVEMLTHKTKKHFGSPVRIYEELPRKMGMTKRTKVASPLDLPEVWHMVPNRRRHRRAY